MHLSNEVRGLSPKGEKISDTLEKIRITLGLPDREWLEKLELTAPQYERIRGKIEQPNAEKIEKLANRLDLSFEAILFDRIDYPALARRSAGVLTTLPERYSYGAHSRRRTSIHLLAYLERFYGWNLRNRVLREFQMNEAAFADPDSPINILFVKDLSDWLVANGADAELLKVMGQYSVFSNRSTPLGKRLASLEDPKSLHQRVFGDIVGKYFDRNCLYRLIRIDDNSCTVEAVPAPEVLDGLAPAFRGKMPVVGSGLVCAAKAGSFSSLTGYLGLPFSAVTETSCVHRGDAKCSFEIDFALAQASYRRLQKSKRPDESSTPLKMATGEAP